jgi:TH1 protein/WW domain
MPHDDDDDEQQRPKQYDWTAHLDDEGQLYYYNDKTDESRWDPPEEGFHPVEADEATAAGADAADDDVDNKDAKGAVLHDWTAHYDEDGQLYYYNAKTDESSWEEPAAGFNPPEEVDAPAEGDKDKEAVVEASEGSSPPLEEVVKQQLVDNNDEKGAAGEEGDTVVDSPTPESVKEDERETEMAEAAQESSPASSVAEMEIDESPATEAPATPLAAPADEENDLEVGTHATEGTPEEDDSGVAEKKEEFDWSAYYDDEGRLYYYNATTEESAWEPPAGGFNPPPDHPGEEEEAEAAAGEGGAAEIEGTRPCGGAEWVAYKDEEGREYFYNQETGETQWDKPDNYQPGEGVDDEGDASVTKSPGQAMDDDVEEEDEEIHLARSPLPDNDESMIPASPEAEPELEIDAAAKRLQDAEEALNQPDSVLEPACYANVSELVAANSGNPAKAISALIENYHGQTAVCGLLSKWLTNLHEKKLAGSTKDIKTVLINSGEKSKSDQIREMAQTVINKMAKERFNKEAGDEILNLSKKEVAFLDEMMESSRWRKLLIDLSAAHKDSAVLLYCLKDISKRGHHREIAKRMNQSDHFAVFNAMLLSELSMVGCQAVSAGSDISAATGLEELLRDLQRACSATSYTYLHSIEMLRKLQFMAQKEIIDAKNSSDREDRFSRALRKWKALSESLESSMMDPSVSQSVAGSSPLFRKRRLDVAATISEVHQRQRKQQRIALERSQKVGNGSNGHKGNLESALQTLLRRHSIGIQLDDSVLDQLLPSGLDLDTRGVGELLIQHPLAARALMGHLYKAGPTRVTSAATKNKCGRLISLAVLAAEEAARIEISSNHYQNSDTTESEEEPVDEFALTRMIVQGSQWCEQLETGISFLVTLDPSRPITSIGQKVVGLALKCAPVGLGVVMWAREFTQGIDYASSASFPTLSPSILSLVRLVAMKHPFARADAIQIGLTFLHHTNSDISYQKVNSIKETALRLLILLLTKGEIVPVLSSITNRMKAGSSDMDASLIRYFVSGILEVVRPPLSPVFVRMFGKMLMAPKAVDAIKSSYFAQENKQQLATLLGSTTDLRRYDGSPMDKNDSSLMETLLSVYKTGA